MTTDAYLIYDGECGFCTTCASWIQRRWPAGSTARAVAWQSLESSWLEQHGLSAGDVTTRAWWVSNERRDGGARAVARALIESGGAAALVGTLIGWPPVSWVAAGVYRLVARYRHRLPGATVACRLPSSPPR